MSCKTDSVVKIYKTIAQIPALVGANINNNGNVVTSLWSQRNIEQGKLTKFIRTHFLAENLTGITESSSFELNNEQLCSISPSEKYRAVIKEIENKNGKKQFLEIWTSHNLMRSVDLAALELHGDVYTDGEFSALQWSPDESKLLYVAEKKKAKCEPFYKRKPVTSENNESKNGTALKGAEYRYRQDWGEQLIGKIESCIVLYDIESDTSTVLEGIPLHMFPAQPVWSIDSTFIVGIAYEMTPRKLGLAICSNRSSVIFKLDFHGNYVELSTRDKAVKSPRFSPDGYTLIWLQRDCGGPHYACVTLVKKNMPLENNNAEIIVNIVEKEIATTSGRPFYGLYNAGFIKRCWASDRRLLLATNQKCTINSYVIDIDTGKITELEYSNGSQVVLDVNNDIVLVSRKNFLSPDKLAIAKLPEKSNEKEIVFVDITTSPVVDLLKDCTFAYMNLNHGKKDEDVDDFTAIYVGPKAGTITTVPLVVWPHGGPHSVFNNVFLLEVSVFCSLGYGVLLINFRGSIGAGQATINYLLKKVGQSDVADCALATKQALVEFNWLNPELTAVVGGSHGGFLVAHLTGQYPNSFKAAVARNPVIDMAIASCVTDIPDWSYVENGTEYTQVGPPSEELLLAMRRASPIEHAHKVKTPTLLQVGSKDVRVPSYQSLEYYHRLKANDITVRMNVYDDNHPLSTVPNEMDNIINTVLWVDLHVK